MFNQDTGLWRDGSLPEGNETIDGYGTAKELTSWEKDLVYMEMMQPEREDLLEDQF